MNRVYRLVWNRARAQWVAASEVVSAHAAAGATRGGLDARRAASARGGEALGPAGLAASPKLPIAALVAGLFLSNAALAQFQGTNGANGLGTAGGVGHGPGNFGGGAGAASGGNGGWGGLSALPGGGGGGVGSGGAGGTATNFNPGGAGVTSGGAGGADASLNNYGGGGGGGGGTGFDIASGSWLVAVPIIGGRGGDGYTGTNSAGGGGGGGGGIGVNMSGNAYLGLSASAIIIGGQGGTGGNGSGSGSGGGGGGGGYGVQLNGGTLSNAGQITGGAGGAGGVRLGTGANGRQGLGGEGVYAGTGSTVRNAGSIAGGLAADGITRANAITFSGNNNTLILESSSLLVGNAVANGSANTLALGGTVAGSFDVSAIGPQYQGFDRFQKIENGTWTLTGNGAQNWSVMAGTLAGNAASFGGNLNIGSGATVLFDAQGSSSYAGELSGSGGVFRQLGPGTLTLLGNSNYGGWTVVDGTLQIGDGGTSGSLGTGGIVNVGSLVFNRSDNLTAANEISNKGSLTHAGAGVLTLTGQNSYSGSTTVSGGVLQIGNGGTTGSLGTGAVINDGALVFNRANNVTVGNAISGIGSVTQAGSAVLTLTGDNIYSGSTTVQAGTLRAGGAYVFSTVSATTVDAGATLELNNFDQAVGSLAGAGNVTLGGATLMAGADNTSTSFAGVISGSGGLTKTGSGTLDLSGANNYSGATSVNAGTLQTWASNTLSAASALTVDSGATLDLNNFSQAIGSLAGAGNVTLGGGTLTAGGDDTSTSFAGVISGNGGLTKTGAGTLTLTGANAYYGATTITGGTLQIGNGGTSGSLGFGPVANNGALVFDRSDNVRMEFGISGSGTVTQAGSGVLTLTGTNSYAGTTTISAGTLQIGNGGTLGTLGTGAVVNDGALVFNRADDVTVDNAISGSGSVVQAGFPGGVLTLTGTNRYTGTTTISAGTLQIGNGGTTGSLGTGAVVDNGALVFNRADNVTVANAISGSGAVIQAGGGILTLTGTNTHAGPTFVTAGVLQAGSAGAFSSASDVGIDNGATLDLNNFSQTVGSLGGAGNVTLGSATLTTGRGSSSSFAGVISGTGGLTKTGSGLLTLSGANSYSGATNISAGVLQAGAANTLSAASAVTVASNAHLALNDFDQTVGSLAGIGDVDLGRAMLTAGGDNTSTSFAGVISGTGGLTKTGTGTFTLLGANSYSGATSVSAGTLRAGSTNTLSSASALTVASGATLDLNNFNQTVGSLGGSGNVDLGSGTLTAGGDNRSTGFAGVFSGTGGFTKVGSGTLTLSGASTNTGMTTVSGGTLGGSGSTGSLSVTSGGTLSPSGLANLINVNGNLSFASGSQLKLSADASGNASRINVSGGGIAIVGGTVEVLAGAGSYQRGTSYTILSSSGARTGEFDTVSTNLAYLQPRLVYLSNGVQLELVNDQAQSYSWVASTRNQSAVGRSIDGFANNPGNAAAAQLVQRLDNLSVRQAPDALDALSGSTHAMGSQVANRLDRQFVSLLTSRIGLPTSAIAEPTLAGRALHYASLDPSVTAPAIRSDISTAAVMGLQAAPAAGATAPAECESGCFWAQALRTDGSSNSDGNGPDLHYGASGLVAGFERPISAQWLVGGAFSVGSPRWSATSSPGSPASGKIDSTMAGLYAHYGADRWNLRLAATVGDHSFTTDRTIGFAAATANSTHGARAWSLGGEADKTLNWGAWQLRPVAGLNYSRLNENGFTETGAGSANLAVAKRVTWNATASAGLHLGQEFAGRGAFEVHAKVSHLMGDADSPVSASLAGQGVAFTASGTPMRRNAVEIGGRLGARLSDGWTVLADAVWENRGAGQRATQLSATLRKAW